MAYTALYRKFRPLTFGEMVGQEAITKTLKNQIISGRVGHAYLFNGGRGTGKTSAAKILARAVNCLNPKDGEPCNECEICKANLEGSLTDVVEMDAASNNSVEDIRGIRDEVNFLPTVAKFRVYIIDEVHMLSTGAFNALLKTLEEPPAHVKFILATTEPQKLPATILSRCQRFDFKKILNEDIIKRLEIVCKESQIDISQEALKVIAVLSEGAMRDALSILERCIQEGEGKVSEDMVKELVGIPKLSYIHALVKAIVEYNEEEVLTVTSQILSQGKDLTNVLWEILKYCKDILVYKASKSLELYNQEELKAIEQLSQNISKDRLVSLIYALSDLENQMKWSSQRLILFQVEMIKLCNKQQTSGIEELQKQVQELKEIIKSGNFVAKGKNSSSPNTENQAKEKSAKPAGNKANSVLKAEIVSDPLSEELPSVPYWSKVLAELKKNGKMMIYTNLINTTAKEMNDTTIGIEFKNGMTSFGKTILEKPESIQELSDLISREAGKTMRIKYVEGKITKQADNKDKEIEDLAKGLDIPIHIIEE